MNEDFFNCRQKFVYNAFVMILAITTTFVWYWVFTVTYYFLYFWGAYKFCGFYVHREWKDISMLILTEPFFPFIRLYKVHSNGHVFPLPNSCIYVHLVAKLFTFEITLLIEKLVNIGNVSSYCNCYHIFIHIPLTFVAYQACLTTSVGGNQTW